MIWCWMFRASFVSAESAASLGIAVHCLRVRSQSFFSSGIPALRRGREILGPGCTPDTSLREFGGCRFNRRAVLGESGTDHFSCDRPAGQGRLNHSDVGKRGRVRTPPSRSKCHLRLTLAAGAESASGGFGRCNRLVCFSRRRASSFDSGEWNVRPSRSSVVVHQRATATARFRRARGGPPQA